MPLRCFGVCLSPVLFPLEAVCPSCQQTMDVFGDHAICCTSGGDLITRHNRVRNLVGKLCEEAKLSPVLEKVGILGHKDLSKRRPGDVTIPLWSKGRGLAIDVSVICPLAISHLSQREPCESYASSKKHALYDAAFQQQSDFDFAAVVFETSGAVNAEGQNFLSRLFHFGSKRESTTHSVYAGRAWQRLSSSVQVGCGRMILSRG